ncbi:MAG: aldo/keto reductase [Candidatus Caldatribacterium sp.]|nr:aldo/keto reductase [Candidatus Caldatribacterium sp.]
MRYRKFGPLDFEVSVLGFGAMRLPLRNPADESAVDVERAIAMIRYAIDQGVNYIDTAYPYHRGVSEVVVGLALQDGYRERVKVATKLPIWLITDAKDPEKYLREQLSRLKTDHIDFYLLHALDRNRWETVLKFRVLEWAEKAREKGDIGYLGFSFHDDLPTFQRIVDAYPWTLCQIQYNYLDVDFQAGREGLRYAAAKGLAVVIMEPLKGGQLARLPEKARMLLASLNPERTPAAWAFLWLWNQKEVTTVLSGMSTMEELEENLRTASLAHEGCLREEELRALEEVRALLKGTAPIPCTTCHYCLPCPQGVAIPTLFGLYNQVFQFGDHEGAKRTYFGFLKESERPGNCTECGLCEERCPQHIPIREWLQRVKGFFENGRENS